MPSATLEASGVGDKVELLVPPAEELEAPAGGRDEALHVCGEAVRGRLDEEVAKAPQLRLQRAHVALVEVEGWQDIGHAIRVVDACAVEHVELQAMLGQAG